MVEREIMTPGAQKMRDFYELQPRFRLKTQ